MAPAAPKEVKQTATGIDGQPVSKDEEIIVMPIGSNSADSMDKITTYSESKDAVYSGGQW